MERRYFVGIAPMTDRAKITLTGRAVGKSTSSVSDRFLLNPVGTARRWIMANEERASRALSMAIGTSDYATALERMYGTGVLIDPMDRNEGATLRASIKDNDLWAVVVYAGSGGKPVPPAVFYGDLRHVDSMLSFDQATTPTSDKGRCGCIQFDDINSLIPNLFVNMTSVANLSF